VKRISPFFSPHSTAKTPPPQGWEVLKTRYPALLEKLRPKYSAVKLGDGDTILWRLEAAAVTSENAAVALCEALRREGEYCFPLHSGEAPKN